MVLNKIFVPKKNAVKGVEDLIRRSSKAVCGVTEREVLVPKKQVSNAIRRLDNAGFHVIGTSLNNAPNRKIWFIRRGGL